MVAALLFVRFFDELASFMPTGTLESFRDDLDLSYALLNPLDETVFAFGIAFLEEERGLTASFAALSVAVANIGGIGALLLAPKLEGRDDDRVLVACGAGLALSAAGFVLLPGWLAVPPLLGVGGGVALAWTVLQHRELTLRPGQAGTTGAAISTISSLEYLAPVAIGALVDRAGLEAGMAVFVTLPVGFAALAFVGIHLSRARLPYRDGHGGGPDPG